MDIDVAQPADWPELERIYRETRLARFDWMRPERIEASTLARDAEGEAVYVAREAGRVSGFVSVWSPDRFVHHLYVDAARDFYLRGGWRVIDRGQSDDGDYLLMEKSGTPDRPDAR